METATVKIIDLLKDHYTKSKDANISRRAHAYILHEKKYSFEDIKEIIMISERTLERWLSRYKDNGIGAIFPGYYNNQNASKVTRERKLEIREQLRKNPLPIKYWTSKGLKSYMSARFDIKYKSDQSFYALLKFCNYSYKLPSLFDIRRDDEYVEKRMREIREEIRPMLKSEEYEVFVSDETRIEWDTLERRAWLRKGKKTIIKEHRDRFYQSFIGFLNLKSGKQHLGRLEWQNQENVIPELEKLLSEYPDKKICIIWDNARWHRGKLLRSHLGQGNKLERLYLINLPPYAPDKNPQERVWRYVKDELGNLVFNRFESMVNAFESITTGRLYTYKF